MSAHPLSPIFEPRSVGVVGASADPAKRGHQVVAALLRSEFAGPVHPINPRGGEILGLDVATSVGALSEPPDLVYVATPAAAVPDIVRECGEAGVRGAIVPAVGFRESGPNGAAIEEALACAARETGIRVVGPNTSGLLNTHVGLHMVGGEPLAPGGLAIVSQSGNVALDLMTTAARRPLGVSIYVGPGNETDVGFHEILEFLGGHDPTRAIVLYIEGIQHGRALYDVVKRLSVAKPVVVLKGGRSDDGVRAARSHTGSIAGSYPVFRAAARQSGMIEVDGSDELFAVGETLALQPPASAQAPVASGLSAKAPVASGPPAPGRGFIVISDGGGHATIAADRFEALGVPLAEPADATRTALQELFGPAAAVHNPVDAAGAPDSSPSVLVRAVEIAMGDPACAGVLLIGLFGGYAIRFADSLAGEESETALRLAEAAANVGKPLVVHSLYERRAPEPLRRLLEAGVPVYGSLEVAAAGCAALWRRGVSLADSRDPDAGDAASGPAGASLPAPAISSRPAGSERWMDEAETRALVSEWGVPVAPGRLCRSIEDLESALEEVGGPWAVKAVARDLPHKAAAGAVRLAVATIDDARRAYEECIAAAVAHLEEAEAASNRGVSPVEGALVCEMQPPPVAELLIGVRRDPGFGPILTVGMGGTDVERSPDVSIRLLPMSDAGIERMLRELRQAHVLFDEGGAPRVDLDSLVAVARAVGDGLIADESLTEIELNPVFAYAAGVVAVDAVGRRVDA